MTQLRSSKTDHSGPLCCPPCDAFPPPTTPLKCYYRNARQTSGYSLVDAAGGISSFGDDFNGSLQGKPLDLFLDFAAMTASLLPTSYPDCPMRRPMRRYRPGNCGLGAGGNVRTLIVFELSGSMRIRLTATLPNWPAPTEAQVAPPS